MVPDLAVRESVHAGRDERCFVTVRLQRPFGFVVGDVNLASGEIRMAADDSRVIVVVFERRVVGDLVVGGILGVVDEVL